MTTPRFGGTFFVDGVEPPTARAGDPWGTDSLVVALPGGAVRVSGLNPAQRLALSTRWQSFLQAGEAAWTLEVCRISPEAFRAFDTRGWDYQVELVHSAQTIRVAGLGVAAVIERGAAAPATAFVRSPGDDYFHGELENVLRIALAHRLHASGGLVLHGASVSQAGRASLFVGKSGAGKSTWARKCHAAGFTVLGDDIAAVIPSARGFDVVAVPFTGDFSANSLTAPQPLERVWLLEQGTTDAAYDVTPAQGVAGLFRCSPWVNRDPFCGDALLDRVGALISAAGAGRLETTLAGSVALAW